MTETYTLDDLAQTYSDLYKEAFGFRPRTDTSSWTEEMFLKEFAFLDEVIERELVVQRQIEQQAIVEFNERVVKAIESGAKDRNTAIAWLFQAEGLSFDSRLDQEHFCYNNCLPFTFFNKVA